jgi:type IV secretory pathway VirB4 component
MAKKSTQDFLEISQIREGVVILKNKSLRGILMISSVNLALKSTEEQTAIINQFQSFLNSLDFTCQIIVQSRKVNLTGYIDLIKKWESKQKNELLQHQTESYRNFIQRFIKEESILSKKFFVVVPYAFHETPGAKLTEESFKRLRKQLMQRMEFVALGLRRCSLQAAPLTSSELIELYWTLHHPKESETGYYPEFPEELIN